MGNCFIVKWLEWEIVDYKISVFLWNVNDVNKC